MRKVYIAISFVLFATLVGAGAVYQLIVKTRLEELAASRQREEQLKNKIEDMSTAFYNTKPQEIIRLYRENTEPWKNAAVRRTSFFEMEKDLFAAKVPEDAIPRFYYKEELPKRIQDLEASINRNRTYLDDYQFGVPLADSFGVGTNPTAEEIEEHLNKYAYGAAVAQLLSQAGAEWIQEINLWPSSTALNGQVGKVDLMGCGVRVSIRTKNLADFLDRLRTEGRFFSIDAIKIVNTDLTQRNDNPLIEVDMILMQSDFEEKEVRIAQAQGAGQSGQLTTDMFSSGSNSGARAEEEVPSWWQMFRKRFLPF